jgi:hypothetical protein
VDNIPLTRSTAILNCAYFRSEVFSVRSVLPELKATARAIASEVCATGARRSMGLRGAVGARTAAGAEAGTEAATANGADA